MLYDFALTRHINGETDNTKALLSLQELSMMATERVFGMSGMLLALVCHKHTTGWRGFNEPSVGPAGMSVVYQSMFSQSVYILTYQHTVFTYTRQTIHIFPRGSLLVVLHSAFLFMQRCHRYHRCHRQIHSNIIECCTSGMVSAFCAPLLIAYTFEGLFITYLIFSKACC